MTTTAKQSGEVKTWTLAKEEELRIEVDADNKITITLLRGTAEVFGTEMLIDHDYTLTDTKLAIFTWHGCDLTLRGSPRSQYTANETPMVSYINAHAALENLRSQAKANSTRGPVTLICGPIDSGKSSLCRLLLNYAVRAGHAPLSIDLDVGLNAISLPGSIAATPIEKPIPIDSTDSLTIKAPLVYYYAHATPHLTELYKQFITSLATTVQKRFTSSPLSRQSGAIINTGGWADGSGYDLLLSIASTFQCDVVLTVGHERLYADLKADQRLTGSIVKLGKSGGVVGRSSAVRASMRNKSVREYFYGPANDLCPHQRTVGWREVSVWRVGGGPAAPSSALPIGAVRLVDPNALVKVTISLELLHAVMAVSYGGEGGQLIGKNVAGFVFVSGIDVQKKTLTLLTPAPGPLPSMCFLTGTVKWFD